MCVQNIWRRKIMRFLSEGKSFSFLGLMHLRSACICICVSLSICICICIWKRIMRSASLSEGKSFGFLGPMHLRSARRRLLTSTAQFKTLPALKRLLFFLFVSTKSIQQVGMCGQPLLVELGASAALWL